MKSIKSKLSSLSYCKVLLKQAMTSLQGMKDFLQGLFRNCIFSKIFVITVTLTWCRHWKTFCHFNDLWHFILVPNDGSLSLSLSSISLTSVCDVIIMSWASFKWHFRDHSIITPYLGILNRLSKRPLQRNGTAAFPKISITWI